MRLDMPAFRKLRFARPGAAAPMSENQAPKGAWRNSSGTQALEHSAARTDARVALAVRFDAGIGP